MQLIIIYNTVSSPAHLLFLFLRFLFFILLFRVEATKQSELHFPEVSTFLFHKYRLKEIWALNFIFLLIFLSIDLLLQYSSSNLDVYIQRYGNLYIKCHHTACIPRKN